LRSSWSWSAAWPDTTLDTFIASNSESTIASTVLFLWEVYRGIRPRRSRCIDGCATRRRQCALHANARLPGRGTRGDIAAQECLHRCHVLVHRVVDPRRSCIAGPYRPTRLRNARRYCGGEPRREGRLCGPVARELRLEVILGIAIDGHPRRLVQLSFLGASACAEGYHGLAADGCWAGSCLRALLMFEGW
jgi:hypothetical protein